jgi:Met-zincin/Domain of unknown function (DUF5117)
MKRNFTMSCIWFFAITMMFIPGLSLAQKKKKAAETPTPAVAPAKQPEKEKTIADLTKGSKIIPGLFTIYQDTLTGALRMVISESQLNQEFILFSHVMNGVVDAGAFKGAYRGSSILTIRKYFDKIEFAKENTGMYFNPDNALSKSSGANVSSSVMLSEKIELTDKTGEKKYLIKCDALFLKETLGQIKPARSPAAPPTSFSLGNLDKDKTKVVSVKNYPENSDVLIEYVYSQDAPLNGGSGGVTDARNVSIQIQHSLVGMPQNDYQPRYDDPRVGYFTTQVNDMTSASATPYRDMISRWNLKKKDPAATLSEPEQPIVWWIENTTPVEFRDAIKEAVLQWNVAFEKAGFKNAVAVNVQPDDATWDAGDIRYNVLRWTASPNPPFGGYGPSFVNPRTGQILGADIMLEFAFHTNRVKYDKLYHLSNSAYYQEAILPDMEAVRLCSLGEIMHENALFGETILMADGASDMEIVGMKKESLMELIMHEVGHTMGLNHNMKGSQIYTPEQLSDKDFIKGKALTASIMDYTVINVTRDRAKQGQYYSPALGPYDLWAIEYGYKPVKSDSELNVILARSTEPQLIFGNDADDMRAPGKAIDPRVNTDDLSSDPIRYSTDRFELVNDLMKKLKSQYTTEGQSYQELRQAFFILNNQYDQAATVISRYIGGVYVDRAMIGQPGATKPYTPVAYADQKRAVNALNKYVFSPDAYKVPNDLYNYLALQRRGFNFFAGPEDPKMHARVIASQRSVLNHLLHQNTMQRIVDSQLYGNKYSLGEYMTDLTNGIFVADQAGNVNTFRQNLQIEYVKMLIGISASKDHMNATRSMSVYLLKDIRGKQGATGDISTRAHREHLRTLIANALEEIK